MIQEFIDNPTYSAWPFWVLELSPTASVTEVEKSANELVGKIKFDVKQALSFKAPEGFYPRDEFLIREAKTILQDPVKRTLAEFWYVEPNLNNNQMKSESNASDWLSYFGVNLWEE